ncbi:putative Serine/threonine phosphatase PPP [Actinacidiphila bryophytorum]|uniref:Serine/threonine phosphatase PPP n=1 Tax=Actinacidiphila bryophytorum TaxID=1436133 RepID=A0A9W4H3H6_9ACTN|nr:putative Serine/threonine phosphatase PPP [Actinacidiphila bryophytorum]
MRRRRRRCGQKVRGPGARRGPQRGSSPQADPNLEKFPAEGLPAPYSPGVIGSREVAAHCPLRSMHGLARARGGSPNAVQGRTGNRGRRGCRHRTRLLRDRRGSALGRVPLDRRLRQLGRPAAVQPDPDHRQHDEQDHPAPHGVPERHGLLPRARRPAREGLPGPAHGHQRVGGHRPALHRQPGRLRHGGQAPQPGDPRGGRAPGRGGALSRRERQRHRHRERGHVHHRDTARGATGLAGPAVRGGVPQVRPERLGHLRTLGLPGDRLPGHRLLRAVPDDPHPGTARAGRQPAGGARAALARHLALRGQPGRPGGAVPAGQRRVRAHGRRRLRLRHERRARRLPDHPRHTGDRGRHLRHRHLGGPRPAAGQARDRAAGHRAAVHARPQGLRGGDGQRRVRPRDDEGRPVHAAPARAHPGRQGRPEHLVRRGRRLGARGLLPLRSRTGVRPPGARQGGRADPCTLSARGGRLRSSGYGRRWR